MGIFQTSNETKLTNEIGGEFTYNTVKLSRWRSLMRVYLLLVTLIVGGCAYQDDPIDYRGFYCDVSDLDQTPLGSRPDQAFRFRNIARLYPNNPDSFGPPPQQQKYSGQRWDRANEYWFADSSGKLHLYVNSDDFYVYHWAFENQTTPILVSHGLLRCGCHFCASDDV